MTIYLFVFFLTLTFALLNFSYKFSKTFFILYCLCIGMFVGFGDMLGGYDRYIYAEVFESNSYKLHSGEGVFNETFIRFFLKEPVYGFINSAIGFFTPNRYIFIIIFTLLMYYIIGTAIYKVSSIPFWGLCIFLGLMFFFSFTYLRQVLASGILWLSLNHIVKRKRWKFLLYVIIASMIHNSAAYFIALYFIPRRKISISSISSIMLILLLLGISGVPGALFTFLEQATGYENIASHADEAAYGFRIEYVIEAVLFLCLLFINYNNIGKDDKQKVYLNTYLMFCGILLLFCKSSDGGRMAWYGVIGIISIMSELCKPKKMITLRAFIGTMLFILYFRILSAWGILLHPYKTFLNPGHRNDDFIYEKYEYDQRYDKDKFYNINF